MDILLKMQDVTLYMLSIKQYKYSYTWCIVYLNILFFFCYNVFSNTQFSVKRLYKSLILICRKQIISFIHFTSLFAYLTHPSQVLNVRPPSNPQSLLKQALKMLWWWSLFYLKRTKQYLKFNLFNSYIVALLT